MTLKKKVFFYLILASNIKIKILQYNWGIINYIDLTNTKIYAILIHILISN